MIIKIFLIILIIQNNYADFIQQFRPFTPILLPQPPPCPNVPMPQQAVAEGIRAHRNETDMHFLLPFMDIDIEIDHNAHVMQDIISGNVFILHGHELFQLFMERQEKRLTLMGYLEGNIKIMEPLAAEVISSDVGHYLLVVALDDYLEIYHIRKDILMSRAELLRDPRSTPQLVPVFPAIQQLSLNGKIKNIFLTAAGDNEIMIVSALNLSKLYGKIRTFKWHQMAFEPLQEMIVPAISVVNVIGSTTKYLITGKTIKHQSKTILTIYEIVQPWLRCEQTQILTLDSPLVHSFSFREQNLIIACASKQSRCKSYLQTDGHFNVFKQRTAKEFTFDRVTATPRFIMATQQNRAMIFTDHHMDCYGSFTSDRGGVSKLLAYYAKDVGDDYALLVFNTPFRLLIRTVRIELSAKDRRTRSSDSEAAALAAEHKQLLRTIADELRRLLPPRQQDIFERVFNFPQPRNDEPNIFKNFQDMLSPKEEKPKSDSLANMFHRMVDVIQPKSKKQEDSEQITNLFHKLVDVVQPESRARTSQSPIFNIFHSLGRIFSAQASGSRNARSQMPITLNSGKIGRVQIVNRFLRSPKQVLEKISELKRKYFAGQREKRSDSAKGPYNITLPLSNHIKVHKLRVKNLIYNGEVIKGFSINHTTQPLPTLSIKSKVKTDILNATEIMLDQKIRESRQYLPDLYYDLTPSVRVKHLKVSTVNGIPWSEFYEMIFLRNRDSTIEGRLVLQSQVEVDHLNTAMLNDLVVDKLFNLRDPQVVNSQLVISRFFVHDLKADKVNGLKFEDDIVFSGQEAHVETPVTMHHLSISGDLFVADKKIERVFRDSDEMEFKQFYTNKVIINGTLVLNNVKLEKENVSKLLIGDEEFQEKDIKEKYLLKNEPQHFNYPIVVNNAKVVAPLLETEYLNNYPTADHMLTDRVNNTKPLLIVFMKAKVPGDIVCRDYKSKIAEIKENLIRPGDVVKIKGKKRFEAPLAVDSIDTLRLGPVNVSDLVFKPELRTPMIFRDLKIFEKIVVKKPAYVEKGIEARYLNKLPLEDLLNYDYHMDHIYVPHTLLAANVVFHKINGIPFHEFFTKLDVRDDQLILHKDLIVEGDVSFGESLETKYINDLEWDKYVENLARSNQPAHIEGHVCFQGDLIVSEELLAKEVNNYNLELIFNSLLVKSRPQLITGQYTFGNLKVSNIDVLAINEKPTNEFLDLSHNHTEFEGDVIVPKVTVKGHLKGVLDETLAFEGLKERIKELPSKTWRNLNVLGNVSWSSNSSRSINTQQELLKYLYKYAVKSHENQIITGNVKFVQPLFKRMRTRLQFPPTVDLNFIEIDALKRNTTLRQKISGRKYFTKPLHMGQLEVRKAMTTAMVNNIDVELFNNSLYRLSSKRPLEATLKFLKPLNIGHLALKGLINGLNTSSIYEIRNNSALPPIVAHQLFALNNVNIKTINHMNVEYFLDNRVTLNSEALEVFGHLTFENLIIENAALLQSINGIPIDSMVFRHSPHLQTITGAKTVEGAVELLGPAHVMRLNDRDLMELYRNTLFNNRNYEFDSLVIDKATFEQGLLVMNAGGRMDGGGNTKPRTFVEPGETNEEDFKTLLQNVNQHLNTNLGNIVYLDYDLHTKVKWQKSLNLTRVNKIVLKEISRLSCCEKQYLKMSFSNFKEDREIYLENITSSRLSAFADRVAVKAENFCKFKYRKVKSKVSISASKLLKVFGMKRFVETIHVLSPDQQQQFAILHALDLPTQKRNEVRIFKIDNKNNTIQDWQGLTQNIGEQLRVFPMSSTTALLTNGLVNNHPSVTVYHFNATLQKFKLKQIIDGDYDIMEMVPLNNGTSQHLILSCYKCQRIFIYEHTPEGQANYEIFQILSLTTNVAKLFMFSIKDDQYMLVISENEPSYYHLYKYAYIQGWIHITYGYYPNLQMSVLLSKLSDTEKHLVLGGDSGDSLPLMLLCNLDNCHIVNAIVQK